MFSQFNSFSFAKKFNDIGVMNYNISLAIMSVMLFERFQFFFFFFFLLFFCGGGGGVIFFFLFICLAYLGRPFLIHLLFLFVCPFSCQGHNALASCLLMYLCIYPILFLENLSSEQDQTSHTHTHSHTTLTSTPAGRGSSVGRARDSL